MAAARGQATREWLELRDAVLARWLVAFVLTQLVLVAASARAEDQAAKRGTSRDKSSATDAESPRLRLRAPRPAAPPPSLDDAIEPPAFGVSPSHRETGETNSAENAIDTMSRPERDPPAPQPPVLSLDIPERPALALPRRVESNISEEALLSPAAATPTISEAPPLGPNPSAPTGDEPPVEVDLLSLIRMEIKQRLPYFEGCARSARRRNGLEIRRLQATWAVAPDGSIKSMKVDGIDDPELGACIVRIGSRPFTVHPGVELLIPTPIVFVR